MKLIRVGDHLVNLDLVTSIHLQRHASHGDSPESPGYSGALVIHFPGTHSVTVYNEDAAELIACLARSHAGVDLSAPDSGISFDEGPLEDEADRTPD